MTRILITGAKGLLGANLCLALSDSNEVYAAGRTIPNLSFSKNVKNIQMDITKNLDLIDSIRPEIIINCAALTNVDYCEDHPDEAEKINAESLMAITRKAKENSSFLIHISTDAVFDGIKGNYSESDKPNPINAYGKSKLLAEKIIIENNSNYAIVRTNIYGWNRKDQMSLAEWMLSKLEENQEFSAFSDITFSPILVNNLADALLEVYSSGINGIINIASPESCTKYEFALAIAEIFDMDKSIIKKSTSEDFKFRAPRAKNMSLDVTIAKNTLKTKLLNIKDGLAKFKELRQSGYVEKLRKNE